MMRISEVSTDWMEEGAALVSVSGVWLKAFGFEVGRKVVIDICQGQIVIKAVDCEE